MAAESGLLSLDVDEYAVLSDQVRETEPFVPREGKGSFGAGDFPGFA